jgi:hypothetical protein
LTVPEQDGDLRAMSSGIGRNHPEMSERAESAGTSQDGSGLRRDDIFGLGNYPELARVLK